MSAVDLVTADGVGGKDSFFVRTNVSRPDWSEFVNSNQGSKPGAAGQRYRENSSTRQLPVKSSPPLATIRKSDKFHGAQASAVAIIIPAFGRSLR